MDFGLEISTITRTDGQTMDKPNLQPKFKQIFVGSNQQNCVKFNQICNRSLLNAKMNKQTNKQTKAHDQGWTKCFLQ